MSGNTARKGLLTLIRKAAQKTDAEQELFKVVYSIASAEVLISDSVRIRAIEELCANAGRKSDLWNLAGMLISSATVHGKKIPVSRLIAWYSLLSEHDQHLSVERGVSALKTKGALPDTKVILQWIERAMADASYKSAAMMIGHADCNRHGILKIDVLCDWVHRSIDSYSYDGNHGASRLFALLCVRLRNATEKSPSFLPGTETLARALYVVYHDEFVFGFMLKGMKARVSPAVLERSLSLLKGHLAKQAAYIESTLSLLDTLEAN